MQPITRRLILREYIDADLEALLAYQGDARAREFYGPGDASPHELTDLLRTFIGWATEAARLNWQLIGRARRELL